MFVQVKISILRSGRKSYQIARALGWHPSKLSHIIAGIYVPDSCEKEDLARELETTVDELFSPGPKVKA